MKIAISIIPIWILFTSFTIAQAPKAQVRSSAIEAEPVSVFSNFITRKGDQLLLENEPFRFLSFNAPELIMREEPYWGFNQPFEQTDVLETIHGFGGRVVRPYVMSIKGAGLSGPRHIEGIRQYNEKVFRSMDFVLAECNRVGVRIIVPFVDNWHWWGGIKEFAALRGKKEKEFYTDEELKADYKHLVSYVLNRRNTITGKLYREDPAVLAWETGNELRTAPTEWTLEMAEFIKGIDTNHLVLDGNDEHSSKEILESPYVDIVVKHYYRGTGRKGGPVHYAKRYAEDLRDFKGKKPFLVGEFGFAPLEEMLEFGKAVVDAKGTGALVWSLRQHEAHGGFRSHIEGKSGFAAYHLPGFPSAGAYNEIQWLTGYRKAAHQLSGLAPEVASVTPKLLPIETVMDIRWQGVPLAEGYDIQQSTDKTNWSFVGRGLSDASISNLSYRKFTPAGDATNHEMFWPILFQDLKAQEGTECFYRIRSVVGGEPSDWSEPVAAIVDRSSGPSFTENVRFEHKVHHFESAHAVNSIAFRCKGGGDDIEATLSAGAESSALIPVSLEKKEDSGWTVFQTGDLPKDARYFELQISADVKESRLALGKGDYKVLKK